MGIRKYLIAVMIVGFVLSIVNNPSRADIPTAQSTPQATGTATSRLLSIAESPRLDPMPTGGDLLNVYLEAVNLAYDAGARGTIFTKSWKDFEPSVGKFDLQTIDENTNYIINVRGFDTMFGIQLINTVTREVPPDLQDAAFDSPQMIDRFHKLIDAIAPHLNRHYLYLSIGNEVDAYLSVHQEWKAYKTFYDDGVAYVHKVLPWIKVGVTSTFDGATSTSPAEVATLNALSDVYIVTYYPLNLDFSPRPPDAPLTDFPKLLSLAGKRPLIMQEVGYPSSSVLSSSEQQQADFVGNVFKAWNAAGDKMPFLSYFLLHDLPAQMCDDFGKYYGLPNNRNFKEFLCTLGLRQVNGTPKLGWQAFVNAAAKKGQ